MNYRHAFHAGNFADVLKHAVLVWAVRYLQQKDAPLCLIDSHGGPGLYDLAGTEAKKTGEAESGILRLAAAAERPGVFEPYWQLVRAANTSDAVTRYPGSPWLMAKLLRANDRAVIGELHPEDASALRGNVLNKRVRIVEGDGYALLAKSVPPPEKRGLVLIDPPFEETDEFERLARALINAHGKWPTGVYLVWYPIKDRAAVERFHAELLNTQIGKLATIEFSVGDIAEGLSACGLALINPPWTIEADWRAPLVWLAQTLSVGAGAAARIQLRAT